MRVNVQVYWRVLLGKASRKHQENTMWRLRRWMRSKGLSWSTGALEPGWVYVLGLSPQSQSQPSGLSPPSQSQPSRNNVNTLPLCCPVSLGLLHPEKTTFHSTAALSPPPPSHQQPCYSHNQRTRSGRPAPTLTVSDIAFRSNQGDQGSGVPQRSEEENAGIQLSSSPYKPTQNPKS